MIYNSPSILDRREACPGSGALEQHCPPSPQNAAMLRGIALHAAVQGRLGANIRPVEGYVLTDHDKRSVEIAVEDTWAVIRAAAEGGPGEAKLYFEDEVSLLEEGIRSRCKVDLVAVLPSVICVFEYKFGDYEVDGPLVQRQIQCYVVGASRKYKTRVVMAAVIQPTVFPEIRLKTLPLLGARIDEISGELAGIVANTFLPSAPLIAGDHCGFCRAKETCPARAGALKDAEEKIKKAPTIQAVLEGLSPQGRTDLLERAKVGKKYLDDAIKLIHAWKLNTDGPLPGYKIGAGKGRRKFCKDVATVWKRLGPVLKLKGWKKDRLQEMVSPATVEEVLSKADEMLMVDLVEKEAGALTVVEDRPTKMPKVRKD